MRFFHRDDKVHTRYLLSAHIMVNLSKSVLFSFGPDCFGQILVAKLKIMLLNCQFLTSVPRYRHRLQLNQFSTHQAFFISFHVTKSFFAAQCENFTEMTCFPLEYLPSASVIYHGKSTEDTSLFHFWSWPVWTNFCRSCNFWAQQNWSHCR